jgi:DNA-binding IclR family transcriptional regulator
MQQYINDAQQSILASLQILAGNELLGLSPSELARELKAGASTVTRDLANLKEAGYAEQIAETGRWRLGPRVVQIGIKFGDALARAESRVGEIQQRYTRTAS